MRTSYDLQSITYDGGEPVIEFTKHSPDGREVVRRLEGDAAKKYLKREDTALRVLTFILRPIAFPYAIWYHRRNNK